MTATFATAEWAADLAEQLQDSAPVRTDSVTWVFGPLLLLVEADAGHGFEATALRIDLHEGSIRSVDIVSPDELARSPLAIVGSLARWKSVFDGSLSIVDGLLESKLLMRGDLPTLARHRSLLNGIAAVGGQLDTAWPQEQEPAAATAG